jgi:hypothetical protein
VTVGDADRGLNGDGVDCRSAPRLGGLGPPQAGGTGRGDKRGALSSEGARYKPCNRCDDALDGRWHKECNHENCDKRYSYCYPPPERQRSRRSTVTLSGFDLTFVVSALTHESIEAGAVLQRKLHYLGTAEATS